MVMCKVFKRSLRGLMLPVGSLLVLVGLFTCALFGNQFLVLMPEFC